MGAKRTVNDSPVVAPVAPAPVASPTPQSLPLLEASQESVVIQTSFLGDMVLTTPLITELALRGPVDVVATPTAAALLANNPAVRRVFTYDKHGRESGLLSLLRLAWRVRSHLRQNGSPKLRKVAYLAQGSIRSAVLAWLARIPERVGFASSSGRVLYTHVVPYGPKHHHAERLLRLAGSTPDMPHGRPRIRPRIYPGTEDVAAVDEFLQTNGLRGRPFIVFAPGSNWGTKRWPYFPDLARRVAARAHVVIVGSYTDRALAQEIAAAAPDRVVSATGRLGLLATAELIRRAVLVVSNDSAPLHLASAMETPTVAIFGPTIPEMGFAPLARRSAIAAVDGLTCRPCDPHGPMECPLVHWRCMRDLSPQRVELLLTALLPTGTV
jgi:heptosyltransferase-2